MEVQNRWKSWVLWSALIAQVVLIGQLTGIWSAIGLESGLIAEVLMAILGVFVIVGVVNNPTDKTDW